MTCDEVRFKTVVADSGDEDLPVQSHLAHCDACRAFAARDLSVRRLMALKRHERPDAFAETRLIARLREAMAETAPSTVAASGAPWSWLAPALRWTVAAAAAVAIVSWLHPVEEPAAPGPVFVTQPAEELHFLGPLDLDHRPVATSPMASFIAANPTNPTSPALRLKAASGTDYHGGRLLPVSFEY